MPEFTPENDPLKPWVRREMWGRTVAYKAEAACGRLADPWHKVPCDFEAGHPTHTSHGDELHSGGCNSYGDRPYVLDQVTRAQREQDGTSPLS